MIVSTIINNNIFNYDVVFVCFEDKYNYVVFTDNTLDNSGYLKLFAGIFDNNYKFIRELKTKNQESNEMLLFTVIKLYSVFGFDNAYKIIRDKFSSMTKAATIRVSDYTFKDQRREYRLLNQNKFYYYGLEEIALKELEKGNYEFFKDFTYSKSNREIEMIMSNFMSMLSNNPKSSKLQLAKEFIIKTIKDREQKYKEDNRRKTEYRISKKENIKINTKILYKLFKDVSIIPELDVMGRVKPNDHLLSVLLGNFKKDNDCTLRLIFNEEAFGLNSNLAELINDFDLFEDAEKKSDSKLSLYSILDLIDIAKANLYKLDPDLRDITLETLSKIMKSREYCTEPEEEILNRTMALHRERKKKVYASIPMVSGSLDGIEYYIPRFDADYLLTSGIDSGDCLKVGGKGEELLNYCLTSPHGVILYLKDEEGNRYNCPLIRTGNGIHGNGIDPEPPIEIVDRLVAATKQAFKEICAVSRKNKRHYENIEYATLTDLHQKEYMRFSKYEKVEIPYYIPLDAIPYSDYNKKDTINYILYKTS